MELLVVFRALAMGAVILAVATLQEEETRGHTAAL